MKTVNLSKRSIYLLLTLLVSSIFTSCNQEEGIDTPPGKTQEIPLSMGQEHNRILDRTLKRMKEANLTRNGPIETYKPGSFYTTPLAIASAEVTSYLTDSEGLSKEEINKAIQEAIDDAIDISEESLSVSETRKVVLSDLIDMDSFSYADKIILKFLENILSPEYEASVEQQIAEINVLKGLTTTEAVINMLDIAASSTEYWSENLDEWEEVVTGAAPTRAKIKVDWVEIVMADIRGAFSGKKWWRVFTNATIASAGAGITQISKGNGLVYYDNQIVFDDGTIMYKNQMKVAARDNYVTITWDN